MWRKSICVRGNHRVVGQKWNQRRTLLPYTVSKMVVGGVNKVGIKGCLYSRMVRRERGCARVSGGGAGGERAAVRARAARRRAARLTARATLARGPSCPAAALARWRHLAQGPAARLFLSTTNYRLPLSNRMFCTEKEIWFCTYTRL